MIKGESSVFRRNSPDELIMHQRMRRQRRLQTPPDFKGIRREKSRLQLYKRRRA